MFFNNLLYLYVFTVWGRAFLHVWCQQKDCSFYLRLICERGIFSDKERGPMFMRASVYSGPLLTKRCHITGIEIINLRWSDDRLKFIMGISIPVKWTSISEYRVPVGLWATIWVPKYRAIIAIQPIRWLQQCTVIISPCHLWMYYTYIA